MKINKSFIVCAAMGSLALLFSSCTSTKVTASFTMPPKAIAAENLSKINTLRIVIDSNAQPMAKCRTTHSFLAFCVKNLQNDYIKRDITMSRI